MSSSIAAPRRLSMLGTLFVLIYLSGTMGLLTVLFVPQGTASVEIGGTPAFLAAWMLLYALTGLVYLGRRLRFSRADLLSAAIGAAFVVSAAWSARPGNTIVYGGVVALNLLFTAQLAGAMTLESLIALLIRLLAALCAIGLALYAIGFQPAIYIDIHDRLTLLGTLPARGLFNHKISGAYYAAMGIVLSLATLTGVRRLGVGLLFSFFVLLTGSATGVALVMAGCAALVFVRLALRAKISPNGFLALLAIIGVTAAVGLLGILPLILEALGRDPTLTGRTLLWAWGIQAGLQHPLIGWGYAGYLGSPSAAAMARTYRDFVGYDVPHFHNGYVQAFAELGVLGVLLMLGLVLGGARAYYREALAYGGKAAAAMSALLLLVGAAGVVMNTFFKYNEFTVVILGIAAMAMLRVGMLPAPQVSTEVTEWQ